jgi:hypothetical protein
LGNTVILSCDLVLDLVSFSILCIDSTDETILRDVFEMSTVLQPGTTGRDMVGCAFTLGLDENGKISGSLSIPRLEGCEDLETIGLGIDGNLNTGAVLRRGLEGVLSGIIASGR